MALPTASDNVFPKLKVSEGTAWATPASGFGVVYEKTDGLLYFKNDAGTEYDLTSTGGAGSIPVFDEGVNKGTATAGFNFVGDLVSGTVTSGTAIVTVNRLWSGARARGTANQAVTAGTNTPILLQAEDYDTDAYHDTGSNTSRFTIPASKNGHMFLLTANYYMSGPNSAAGGSCHADITINVNGTAGGTAIAFARVTGGSAGFYGPSVSTVYQGATGDYFEVFARIATTGGTIQADGKISPQFTITDLGGTA